MNNLFGQISFTDSEMNNNFAEANTFNLIYSKLTLERVEMEDNLADDICSGFTMV